MKKELDEHFKYKIFDNPIDFFNEIWRDYIWEGKINLYKDFNEKHNEIIDWENEKRWFFEDMPVEWIRGYLVIYECLTDKYRIYRKHEKESWERIYKYPPAIIFYVDNIEDETFYETGYHIFFRGFIFGFNSKDEMIDDSYEKAERGGYYSKT